MNKIIDAHCHIYPDKIAEKASESTGIFYDLPPSFDGKVSTLLSLMEKYNITHAVIQSVATTPKQVSSINRFIAEAVKSSNGKFTGFGTLHQDSDDIERDINELINLGLKGVKLHPDIQKVKLDDYRLLKMYELCEGRLPFLIHTGDNRYDFSNPNRLIPILETFKELTIIGAHFGGWSIWSEATEKLYKYENFYVDTSSSFYALTPEKSLELINKYGYDKVLFGTDYPLWNPGDETDYINKLDLTDDTKDKIFYKNALNLFNIK